MGEVVENIRTFVLPNEFLLLFLQSEKVAFET
jgi:hypothetical protein